MRLSPHERQVLRAAALRHFGVEPRLFGSRLDDGRRGGDIDLVVRSNLPPEEAVRRRLDMLAEVWRALGERKIDIVLDDGAEESAILLRARREALPL